ncbi:hypothetical protein [Nodosilinea nodulosa]|uniref:hypothetical protein n=1 Tax=Nodosilinea nodulosa TaxID=416001 RepID=UPI0002F28796|nr:hypothetical protein [Nodosilinea nodulosa]
MRPQDPNFPQEIPPIPPPRDSGETGPGDEPVSPSLDASAGPEPVKPEPVGTEPVEAGAVDSDSVDPGPGEPESATPNVASARSDDGQGRASFDRASLRSDAAAASAQSNGRHYDPDAAPWTDSDLQNVEEPASVPVPEPQPAYNDRYRDPSLSGASSQGTRSVPPAEDVWAETGMPYQPKELGVVDQLLLVLAEGVTLWKKGLRWVRSLLPSNLQRQLSDEILTAIALGLLVLLLALGNPLGSGQGDRAVASEPGPRPTAAAPDTSDRFAEPALEAEQPAALDPAPVVEPTPEQSLITDIQDRVSRISRSYSAGLVQSVEVNLPENTLGVNVAEAWYGLLSAQQDEVAQDILAQAQGLKFGTLQLRDPDGVVVARNPVVGPNMVVLRRQRSLDADWRTE